MEQFIYLLIFLLVFGVFTFIIGLRVVPIGKVYVVERLGVFQKVIQTGIHYIIFPIDRVAKCISLEEQEIKLDIDKYNIVLYYQIVDAKLFTYGVTNHIEAIKSIVQKEINLRHKDDEIKSTLKNNLEAWGIKANNLEIFIK